MGGGWKRAAIGGIERVWRIATLEGVGMRRAWKQMVDKWKQIVYTLPSCAEMIGSFRHRGLRQLFEDDLAKGVNPDHVRKLKQISLVLQASQQIEAVNLPTFRLHPLTGGLKGFWSITVRANWRLIFRFEDGMAFDIDLVDYH